MKRLCIGLCVECGGELYLAKVDNLVLRDLDGKMRRFVERQIECVSCGDVPVWNLFCEVRPSC